MQNSMMIFFFFLRLEIPCWVYLVQNFRIVNLIWNLVHRIFRTCKIWWWCSLFLLQNFFCKFCLKPLPTRCYLINLLAIYSQKLEASCFSCFLLKLKFKANLYSKSVNHLNNTKHCVWHLTIKGAKIISNQIPSNIRDIFHIVLEIYLNKVRT